MLEYALEKHKNSVVLIGLWILIIFINFVICLTSGDFSMMKLLVIVLFSLCIGMEIAKVRKNYNKENKAQ